MWPGWRSTQPEPTPEPPKRDCFDWDCPMCKQKTVSKETAICSWCQWDTVLYKYVSKPTTDDSSCL